jgi:Tol biopolymer transport system component
MIQELARFAAHARAAFLAASCAALFAAAVAVAEPNAVATVPLSSTGNGSSGDPRFDRNGRFAVFHSSAENLVAGQSTSGQRNVFLFDRSTGEVSLVSHAADDPLRGGNAGVPSSMAPQISADGKWVAFVSSSTDLVSGQDDTNGTNDVFLWSRETGTTRLVSHRAGSPTGTAPNQSTLPALQTSISADGRYLAFSSSATELIAGQVANGHPQIYLYDRNADQIRLISHASSGIAVSGGSRSEFPSDSLGGAISGDGRFVVFTTLATDLVTGVTDTNNTSDVYLWDRDATLVNSLRLLSRRAGNPLGSGNSPSGTPAISADGKFVVLTSRANNLEGVTSDTNTVEDVFRYDRAGDSLRLVSHRTGATTITANAESSLPVISGGGDQVAFQSIASNLVVQQDDSNGVPDVFLWRNGESLLVSRVPESVFRTGNGTSRAARIGLDGGVAFDSFATNLVAGVADSNGGSDVFLKPRLGAAVSLVSHVPSENATGDRTAAPVEVLFGGALATFESAALNLIDGPINGGTNLFVHGSLLMADGFESGDFSAWSQQVP